MLWRQMLADVYGCPVKTIASKESPALGVALLAAVGAGIYGSVAEACAAVIEYGDTRQPNKANTDEYAKFYALYKEIYPNLKTSFEKLGKL